MNNQTTLQESDEIDLIDIFNFLKRQCLLILIIAITISSIAFIYAVNQPTIWQSKVSLLIGEKLYFYQPQQPQLIESLEDIKYRYSKGVDISIIKNTRIIELSSTQGNKEMSVSNVNAAKDLIISNHKKILEDKKINFLELIDATSKNNTARIEFMNLIDNASNSTETRELIEIKTEEKKYSGKFLKIMGIGIFLSLVLAFTVALIKDYIKRNIK